MPISDRQCTFTHSPEIEGQRKKTEGKGITRSEIVMKQTEKGTYPIVFVEVPETGELLEVFANTLKFVK